MTDTASTPMALLSSKAAELHNEMMSTKPLGYLYDQLELQDMILVKSITELMKYIQELTDNVYQAL